MKFSLIDNVWIPATTATGQRHWLRPDEITTEIGGLSPLDCDWGRPDLRIATYELLIGIFAVALAIRESGDQRKLMNDPPTRDQLAEALAPLSPFLVLDGEGPRFQQDQEALHGETLPVDALFMDSPGANTVRNAADIFVHRDRMPVLSRKGAAIALHALQAFAPSGGAGHRTSMRGGGPLTTLVVPAEATLWRRIAANLPLLNEKERRKPGDLSRVFPWARPTLTSGSGRKAERDDENGPHWLQHYFGMPRRIRLEFADNPEGRACSLTGDVDDRVATGFVMTAYGTNYGIWEHPLTPHYQDNGKDVLPVHAQSSRAGWRDWLGWLVDGKSAKRSFRVADAIRTARNRDWSQGARVLAAGYVTDNMKTLDFVEAEIPLVALPDGGGDAVRQTFVASAELVASRLRTSLAAAFDAESDTTLIASAMDGFWLATEQPFRDQLARLAVASEGEGSDIDRPRWRKTLARAALAAFDDTVRPEEALADADLSRVRRIVEARKGLVFQLTGYGKSGAALFGTLGLPVPEPRKSEATP